MPREVRRPLGVGQSATAAQLRHWKTLHLSGEIHYDSATLEKDLFTSLEALERRTAWNYSPELPVASGWYDVALPYDSGDKVFDGYWDGKKWTVGNLDADGRIIPMPYAWRVPLSKEPPAHESERRVSGEHLETVFAKGGISQ